MLLRDCKDFKQSTIYVCNLSGFKFVGRQSQKEFFYSIAQGIDSSYFYFKRAQDQYLRWTLTTHKSAANWADRKYSTSFERSKVPL